MANKRINDLQIRSNADDTINIAADDSSQTWRVTGAQILAFIRSATAFFTGLSADASPQSVDLVATYDVSATANKKVTKADFLKKKITALTAAGSAGVEDDIITCDATSAAFTVSLPTAVGIAGKVYTVKKIDSGANIVTVDANASETIDGALTVRLCSQYDYVTVVSDGANWAVSDSRIIVSAVVTGAPPNSYTSGTPIIWPTVSKDPQGNYNTSNGEYAAEFTGFYSVNFAVNTNLAANSVFNIYVAASSKEPAAGMTYSSSGIMAGGGRVFANAGDKITVRCGTGWSIAVGSPSGVAFSYVGKA